MVGFFATVLFVGLLITLAFVACVTWAWKTQEGVLPSSEDDAELRELFKAYCVAVEKATKAAQGAPKPLEGEALRRFLDADAEAMNIVSRIKEIGATRKPHDLHP